MLSGEEQDQLSDGDHSETVTAIGKLSYLGADQASAYREHAAKTTAVLGPDARTKLMKFVADFATDTKAPPLLILTGNAGTGKTALAQQFCAALGKQLPSEDGLKWITSRHAVLKDLSGIPHLDDRVKALRDLLKSRSSSRAVVCANEGILRSSLSIAAPDVADALDRALLSGADVGSKTIILNLNRQRATSAALWTALLDYLLREELWAPCKGCPHQFGACPPSRNALLLRQKGVQDALRFIFRYAVGSITITLRDALAVFSWMICGDARAAEIGDGEAGDSLTCDRIKQRHRDLGSDAFDARTTFAALAFGQGLPQEAVERAPVIKLLRDSGLGALSDLRVDGWLRNSADSPPSIKCLLRPSVDTPSSLETQFRTEKGTWSFEKLGEILTTSEDQERVDAALEAIRQSDALNIWRRLVFFFAAEYLGGPSTLAKSLTRLQFFGDLLTVANRCAEGRIVPEDLSAIVRGLNVLVTGYNQVSDGLIVPDGACLFSRDPGSFVPPEPCIIHSQIDLTRLSIRVPDRGAVREIMDVDDIEIELTVDNSDLLRLTITPMMYEAIRQADVYSTAVGRGDATMTDIRDFYGRLSLLPEPLGTGYRATTRIAEFRRGTASLVSVQLPQ